MISTFSKFQKATWIFKPSSIKRSVNIAKKKFWTQQHVYSVDTQYAGSSWKAEELTFLNVEFQKKMSKIKMKDSFAGIPSIMKGALLFIFIPPLAGFFLFKMGHVGFSILCIETDMESFQMIATRTILITKLMNKEVAWSIWPKLEKSIWTSS